MQWTQEFCTTGTKSSQAFAAVLRRRRSYSLRVSVLMADRLVRFLPQFFDELDNQLPEERDLNGGPSATDFLIYDLPRIRDRLAFDFERSTLEVLGAEPLRVLIGSCTLVHAVAIYAYLDSDDDVAVIAIDIQLSAES